MTELLAPAGDLACLKTAVRAGADAVYFGGGAFNARENAKNFNENELIEGIDFCHSYHAKAYITLNTQLHNSELPRLAAFTEQVYAAGADALIVGDIGIASFLRRAFPDFELHASTQMSICNLAGVEFLQQCGFKRVVLARELDRKNIETICKNTKTEIEIFVHGALCVSYSGQCLMSSMLGGRSGNRGKCAQPCRLPYSNGKQTGFLMSPKDYCLIEYLKEIKQAGVASLKIEGRMKGESYVGEVVSIYRSALDSGQISAEELNRLYSVFNRGGYTDAYFTKNVDQSMFCYTKPDNPYLKQSETASYPEKKLPLSAKCCIQAGEPVALSFSDGNQEYSAAGERLAEPARGKAVTREEAIEKISRLGGTPYRIEAIDLQMGENLWFPISELNRLRQTLCKKLTDSRIIRRRPPEITGIPKPGRQAKRNGELSVFASTTDQYRAAKLCGVDTIYLPYSLLLKENITDAIAAFPPVWFDDEQEKLIQDINALKELGVSQALISNLGYIELLQSFELITDFHIGTSNSLTAEFLQSNGMKRATLSVELNRAQLRELWTGLQTEAIVYGRLPLMYYENCPGDCSCCNLTDRRGISFPLSCQNLNGRSALYNSVPLYLLDSGIQADKKRLMFTFETEEEVKHIIESAKLQKAPDYPITRGHFTRGV